MAALKDEFSQNVAFYPAQPGTISAPAVTVVPGDPFITVGTMNTFEERWLVSVYANMTNPGMAVNQLRDNSLRVKRCVSKLGARWAQASVIAQVGDNILVTDNEVVFRYTME